MQRPSSLDDLLLPTAWQPTAQHNILENPNHFFFCNQEAQLN